MWGTPQIKLPMKSSLQHTLILHTCAQNLSPKLLRDNGRCKAAAEIEPQGSYKLISGGGKVLNKFLYGEAPPLGPTPKCICSLSFNLTRVQVLKFLCKFPLYALDISQQNQSYCNQNPTLILQIFWYIASLDFRLPNYDEVKILKIQITFWDRKSAIKCRASRAFFPTCLLPCTRRSHGRHSPRFACLLALFTLAPIALLRQNKPCRLLYLGHAQIMSL